MLAQQIEPCPHKQGTFRLRQKLLKNLRKICEDIPLDRQADHMQRQRTLRIQQIFHSGC